MAEEIIIGKLIIDNSDLDRALIESKRAIIDVENEQKKLKKDTEGLSKANEEQLTTFVANEAVLKKLRGEYAANQKTVLTVMKAQTGLDEALKQNIKTQDQAIANTKQLTEARRQIDTTTVEGAKAINEINYKIDQNNKLINGSSAALEQQKNNVGNYPQIMGAVGESFKGATTQIVGFAQQGKGVIGELKGTVENFRTTQEASKVATEAFTAAQIIETQATEAAALADTRATVVGFRYAQGVATETEVEIANTAATAANAEATAAQAIATQAATTATEASTIATKALRIAMLSIPLVLLLSLLAPLIAFLTSTQEGMDKITAVTRPLVAVFQSFFGVLQEVGTKLLSTFTNPKKALNDLYEFVKQNLINRFTALGVILEGIINLDFKKVTNGVLQAGTGVENLTGKIAGAAEKTSKFLADAAAKGAALDRLEKSLEVTRNKNILALGKATEEVKAQNRIAEDQTRTSKERETATKLSIVAGATINRLKNQELDLEIAILKNRQSRNNTSRKEEGELNALIAKKNENNAANLELETTQNNKLVSIRKEAANAAKAANDEAKAESLKNQRNAIDIIKAEAAQRDLSTKQRIELAKKVFELENDLAKKSSTGTEQQKALLANRQALSAEILAIADEQIKKEADAQKKLFSENKKITQEQRDAQLVSAEDLAKAQTMLLDKTLLSEKAYADEVVKINVAKLEAIGIVNAAFEEGEKLRKEQQLVNEKAIDEASFQIKLLQLEERAGLEAEIKGLLLTEQYNRELELLDQSLADKKVSEEAYLAQKALAEKKYNGEQKKNDKALRDQRNANNVKMANDAIGALQNLFGESKALNIAAALMNTYEGITAALKAPTLAGRIAGVAFATTAGFAAVKNILKTTKNSTSVEGAAVTTTGSGSFVNNAQTSTIATVSERPTEQNTIVTPPVLILETLQEKQNEVAIKINSN